MLCIVVYCRRGLLGEGKVCTVESEDSSVCQSSSSSTGSSSPSIASESVSTTCFIIPDQLVWHCMNSLLNGLLNFEIGGLDSRIISTEYRTRVHCIHM